MARETWKIILSEFEELFDRIFKMRTEVDFSFMKSTTDYFEAPFLPSSKFNSTKLQKSKSMRESVKNSEASKSLEDFLSGKLVNCLDLNFLYIPLVLNVIYKPLVLVTSQIEGLCSKSAMRELVKESVKELNVVNPIEKYGEYCL